MLRLVAFVVGAIIGGDAGATIAHQPGLLQLGQMGRHARLGQVQHGRQFGHREFLVFKQGEQADPGGVGKQAQHA